MPDGARSTDFRRQDSGLCTDLMNRLSLSDRQGSTGSSSDVWREYYEPDDDGDVQLHLAIASGYLEVVDSLIRMAPTNDFLSIQNNQVRKWVLNFDVFVVTKLLHLWSILTLKDG